ncbi:MAG: hypothetical protein IJ104_02505 [Methanobrevibacter sp.]|nr:hypothetical protein [Methanobrevibacter sp.]
MKNNDISHVKKIIEYCDIVDSLLEEYGRDYLVFQSSNLFNYLQACVLFKLENMLEEYLMNLNSSMGIFLGIK